MRLVDADAYMKKVCTYKETGCGCCIYQGYCPVDEPTVEAKEVVHGKWETDRFGLDRSVCSICGAVYEGDGGNFCPNCGADMRTSAE